jgi:hypothetical protein
LATRGEAFVRISLLLLAGALTLTGATSDARADSALGLDSKGSGTRFAGDAAVLPPALGSTVPEDGSEDLDSEDLARRAVPRSSLRGVGWARGTRGVTINVEPAEGPDPVAGGLAPSRDPFADLNSPVERDVLEIFDRRPFLPDFAPLERPREPFELLR